MKNKGEIVDLYSLIIAKFLSDDEKKFTEKKKWFFERFTLTESVESFFHLYDVDVDLLLYEVLDERIAQGILQRKKHVTEEG